MTTSKDGEEYILPHEGGDLTSDGGLLPPYLDDDHENIDKWIKNLPTTEEFLGGKHYVAPPKKDCYHKHDRFDLIHGHVFLSAKKDTGQKSKSPNFKITGGVYLDKSWLTQHKPILLSTTYIQPSARSNRVQLYVDWPDMKALEIEYLADVVKWIHQRLNREALEIACIGGHGRTGTLAAALLVSQGMNPETAIEVVRRDYCKHAIETTEQENSLYDFADFVR